MSALTTIARASAPVWKARGVRPCERQRLISLSLTRPAGVDDLRPLDAKLDQFDIERAEAFEAAASADHGDVNLIILEFDDIHHLFAQANAAARFDRFQRFARRHGEARGLVVHVADDRQIAVDPLVAREEGDRLVAQHQDDAQGRENGQQTAGEEPGLNRGFMRPEPVPQVERTLAALNQASRQVGMLLIRHLFSLAQAPAAA